MPAYPPAPASFEWRKRALVAANPNPFNGREQVFAWSANPYFVGSVLMPTMTFANAQNWTNFITACNGPVNTFAFGTAACAAFPYELTTDGTTPRLFRLSSNEVSWSIILGKFYSLTFEIREAL